MREAVTRQNLARHAEFRQTRRFERIGVEVVGKFGLHMNVHVEHGGREIFHRDKALIERLGRADAGDQLSRHRLASLGIDGEARQISSVENQRSITCEGNST